jgi:hypothetical protein
VFEKGVAKWLVIRKRGKLMVGWFGLLSVCFLFSFLGIEATSQ